VWDLPEDSTVMSLTMSLIRSFTPQTRSRHQPPPEPPDNPRLEIQAWPKFVRDQYSNFASARSDSGRLISRPIPPMHEYPLGFCLRGDCLSLPVKPSQNALPLVRYNPRNRAHQRLQTDPRDSGGDSQHVATRPRVRFQDAVHNVSVVK